MTTAEQRHPKFIIDYNSSHECLWNGPTWPYATSITLTAVANILNDPNAKIVEDKILVNPKEIKNIENKNKIGNKNNLERNASIENIRQYITKKDYFNILRTFALSHRRKINMEEKEHNEKLKKEKLIENNISDKRTLTETIPVIKNKAENKVVFWIDENLNPKTGEFLFS